MTVCGLTALDSSLPHLDLLRLRLNLSVIRKELHSTIDVLLGIMNTVAIAHEAKSLSQSVVELCLLLVGRSPICTEKKSHGSGSKAGLAHLSTQESQAALETTKLVHLLRTSKKVTGHADMDLQRNSAHSHKVSLGLVTLDLEGQLGDTVCEVLAAGLCETCPHSAVHHQGDRTIRTLPKPVSLLALSVTESLVAEFFLAEEVSQECVGVWKGGFLQDCCNHSLCQVWLNMAVDLEVVKTVEFLGVGLEKALLGEQSVSDCLSLDDKCGFLVNIVS